MNKFLLPLLLTVSSLAQAQQPFSYTVKGKLGNVSAPAKVYLVRGFTVLDSAAVKNGAFEIKGTTAEPISVSLILRKKGCLNTLFGALDRTQLFLEPGTTVVTSPDSMTHATTKGGLATTDYFRLQKSLQPVFKKSDAFGNELVKVAAEQQRPPSFDAPEVRAQFESFNKHVTALTYAFIKANPGSWASLDALEGIRWMDLPQYATVAPLYEGLSPQLRNSAAGREYGELVKGLKTVAVGAQAPEFAQQTPDGKTVSLSDYRGKYVLVEFWASWCGPCRQENPAVIKAYNEYKDRNFDVLSVSFDDEKGRAKWLKAIAEDQLPWAQVSDLHGMENEVARLYQIHSIPQNYLIDPNGKILASNLKGEGLRAALAQYVK